MPIRLNLPPTLHDRLATATRPLFGTWVVSGSPVVAEIIAGSGIDLVFVDGEHSANTLESIQTQLQVIAAYPVTPVVRVPVNDAVVIKQFLDLGAQNLIVPMVDTAEQAEAAVRASRYPPRGIRGVGSALARGARWNRVEEYLQHADQHISLTLQIESATAVEHAAEIFGVDGVEAVFIGPSDLAASMGVIGQQDHADVVAAVTATIALAKTAGVKVGVNAFAPAAAAHYVAAGADFVFVGADVALLARASEALADRFIDTPSLDRASY
ncbi:MAG: 2-dehydro-3-deoxyglucarate aldolase [Salinibacterium sp.]|nr:2-dehydro-3-deoxyglucarate aldolase [Salinibacterium sp.]